MNLSRTHGVPDPRGVTPPHEPAVPERRTPLPGGVLPMSGRDLLALALLLVGLTLIVVFTWTWDPTAGAIALGGAFTALGVLLGLGQ